LGHRDTVSIRLSEPLRGCGFVPKGSGEGLCPNLYGRPYKGFFKNQIYTHPLYTLGQRQGFHSPSFARGRDIGLHFPPQTLISSRSHSTGFTLDASEVEDVTAWGGEGESVGQGRPILCTPDDYRHPIPGFDEILFHVLKVKVVRGR
jgi:hypothetical protein